MNQRMESENALYLIR